MKKSFFIFLGIILAVIFQASIFPLCFSEKNIPDIVFVMMISAVSVFGFQSVWIWAIISGIILDIFSFSALGLNVFSFAIFSYFASFFSRRLILGGKSGGILVGIIFVSLATLFHNFWIQLTSAGFNFQWIREAKIFFLESIGWKIILNLILFFVLMLIFKEIKKKFHPSNSLIVGK